MAFRRPGAVEYVAHYAYGWGLVCHLCALDISKEDPGNPVLEAEHSLQRRDLETGTECSVCSARWEHVPTSTESWSKLAWVNDRAMEAFRKAVEPPLASSNYPKGSSS